MEARTVEEDPVVQIRLADALVPEHHKLAGLGTTDVSTARSRHGRRAIFQPNYLSPNATAGICINVTAVPSPHHLSLVALGESRTGSTSNTRSASSTSSSGSCQLVRARCTTRALQESSPVVIISCFSPSSTRSTSSTNSTSNASSTGGTIIVLVLLIVLAVLVQYS
jgi:hypothetical protein